MSQIKTYLVGGSVRDAQLGIKSKDLDYVVEADFEGMRAEVLRRGCTIVHEKPEFLTMRVKTLSGQVQDFACCRNEADYDGRRPGSTKPTSLLEDLARRDFTVNAMAVEVDDQLIPNWDHIVDPFNGQDDLKDGILRFVGNAEERIQEDGLRWLRAIRFSITRGFKMTSFTYEAVYLRTDDPLHNVSVERIREELVRCFKHDTLATLDVLNRAPKFWYKEGLWLTATLEER